MKVGDTAFQDVTVTSVTATDRYFTHSAGMGNAKLKKLPPDLQRQFGYDPKTAASVEESRTQGAAAFSVQMQRRRELEFQQAEVARRAAVRDALIAERKVQQRAARSAGSGGWTGKPAPVLKVEKWLTAKPNPAGKFVVVDFWATWCAPCCQSIPHLNALRQRFSSQLVIIGLSSETEADVRKMTSPTLDYYSAIDPQGRTARQVSVSGIPHVLLIDPSGIVRYQGHPSALTAQVLEGLLVQFGG